MGFYNRKILPKLLDLAMRNPEVMPFRQRTISRAKGKVLEIGVGSGLNLPLYGNEVSEVVGLDPHPAFIAMASRKQASVPVKILEASAESIPLEDASVDSVIVTWTLCSIPDVATALREMRRVLKPAGQLLFVEHGLSPDPNVVKWQHRLTPTWKKIAGGCHLDRAIEQLIRDAGFLLDSVETGYAKGPKPMTFMYEGIARPD